MVRKTEAAVHRTHPEIKVLISGETLQMNPDGWSEWLKNLLAADPTLNRLPNIAYSVHPYSCKRGPLDPLGGMEFALYTHQRDPTVPVWITEVGWSSATASACGVGETTQATFLRGAVLRALDDWGTWAEKVFVFSFDRSGTDLTNDEGNYGLRRADDSVKPAWRSITQLLSSDTPTRRAR
jgi:hypothetical protein